jgi:tetratricopeptide (TPR) repeat protein
MPASPPSAASIPSPIRHPRWITLAVCTLLAAGVWFVFGQTLHHRFVNFDDDVYVYKNPFVLHGLSLAGVRWAFTHSYASNWHPLAWISHMLDCQLFGLDPAGHHLTSILLHAAASAALFLVLHRLTGFLGRSAFVAALFAIHPLHVESVAWVAERKDVLSGLFFVLTLGAYERFARSPFSLARYALVLLLAALGLLAKPMLVTLPLILLLLDYWPLQRFSTASPKRLLIEKLPILLIAAGAAAVTIFVQHDAKSHLPLPIRLENATLSAALYLGQLFYPARLAAFYPFPETGLPAWQVAGSALLLAAISLAAWAMRKRHPWFLFGWLWYLVMLAPVIGILQVGSQAHADRYTYLPHTGLYVIVAWGAAELARALPSPTRSIALGSLAAIALGILTFSARQQASYWQDSTTLWTHTLAVASDSVTARINLGNADLENGKLGDAMDQFRAALRISPDNPDANVSYGYILTQKGRAAEALPHFLNALAVAPDHPLAHNDLGIVLAQQGNLDEAISHFRTALQLKPVYPEASYNLGNALSQKGASGEAISQYQEALRADPACADAAYNMGNALSAKGDAAAAMAAYREALGIRPAYVNAGYNLAMLLMQRGAIADAIAQFQQVLQWKPDFPEAHYNLATALFHQGARRDAIAHLQQALQLKPDYADAANDLAWELATSPEAGLRDGTRAVSLARHADELAHGQDVDILDTVAAACAEDRRFDDAIQAAQKAIALSRATGRSEELAQLNSELRLYQAGQPFHQSR